MRRLLLASAAFVAAGSAMAADMPLKAPPPFVDPWVGLYVGGNVGYGLGRLNGTTSVDPFTQGFGGTTGFTFPGASGSTGPVGPNGFKGGGQIGDVWRLHRNWLVGIEGDLQWSGEKGSRVGAFGGGFGVPTSVTNCVIGISPSVCSYSDITSITARLSWFGTLRFRGGYETNGLWFYGTVGPAIGTLKVSGASTLTVNGSLVGVVAPPVFTSVTSTPFSYSTTKVGISGGVGVEGLIGTSKKWRWKTEYLFLGFGPMGGGSFGVFNINSGRFTDQIIRFGINYNFGEL
jgi:outer membrane immunogenic protein